MANTSHSFCSSGKAPWRPEASQVLRLGSQACQASVIRQLAMLKAEGCGRIFKEKLSGREGVRRPQLDKAIEALGAFDAGERLLAECGKRGLEGGVAKRNASVYRSGRTTS